MKKAQALRENYEYSIPKEDLCSIKAAATAKIKRLTVAIVLLSLTLAVLFILLSSTEMACAELAAGVVVTLFLVSAIRTTNRGFEKTKDAPEDLACKIRIYDDFFVCERSSGEGISLLHTVSLYDLCVLGETEKYIVISSGVYAISVPKSVLNDSSYLFYLCSLKGAKPKRPEGAPIFFAEPPLAAPKDGLSPAPCEKTTVDQTYADNVCAPSFSEEITESTAPVSGADVSDGADSFRSGSFDAYDESEPHPAASTLAESVIVRDKNKKLKLFGRICFAASLFSIFAALITAAVAALTQSDAFIPLLLISLIPVSSLIVGVVLWIKRERCFKNILTGILALLIITSVDPSDMYVEYDNSEEGLAYIASLEQKLSIDLPETDTVYYYTVDTEDFLELSANVTINECDRFVEYAKTDKRFVKGYPNTHVGLLPEYYRDSSAIVATVYNETTGEYNTLPTEAGTYRMIYVALYRYDDSSAHYVIYEYDLEYATDFK